MSPNDTILYLGLVSDEEIELDSAALALSGLDHDGADLKPYLDLLAEIGKRVAAEGASAATGQQIGATLAEVLGTEYGFAGDIDTYDAPLNADMIWVLDRRRGLPVSLSILYVAAARRAGWDAEALNTPSHVLVRVGPASSPAIVDPFNGGALVEPDRLIALLTRALGPGVWPTEENVAPMSNRMTLVRLLQNQALRAEQSGDSDRAAVIYQRMTIIAPSHGQGWWDLARLQLVGGAVDAARASLSAMLEVTRDPERRVQITNTLAQLGG